MPQLKVKQIETLKTLQEKFKRGDVLSGKEEEALSLAEEEGLVEERGILDSVGAQFRGEKGRETGVGAVSLLQEVSGAGGGLKAGAKLASKIPLPGPLGAITRFGLKTVGAGAGASGGNVLAQLGIQGKEEADLGETALAGLFEAVFPIVGKAVVSGFKAAGKGVVSIAKLRVGKDIGNSKILQRLAGVGNKPTPFKSPAAEDLARETQKAGVTVPLATVFEGKLLSTMDSLASKSLTGSTGMTSQTKTTQEFLESRIEDFAAKFTRSASPLEIATQLQKALRDDLTTFKSLRNKIIGRLDIASVGREGAKVDLSGIGKGSVSFKEALSIIEEVKSPKITSKVKAAMLKSARKLDTTSAPIDEELAKLDFPENKFITEELEKIRAKEALQSSVDFVDDVRITFDLTERMGAKFNHTIIERLANTKPEEVLDLLLSTGRPDTVRTLFKMKDIDGKPLLSEDIKDGIRAVFLGLKGKGGGLLSRAADSKGAVTIIDGKKLLGDIARFEKLLGKGASMALFPGTGLEGVKRFGKMLEVLQSSRGEGSGAMALFLQTPGAVASVAIIAGGIVTGEDVFNTTTMLGLAGAGTILLGPKALTKMLTNPKTFDAFAKGFEKRLKRPDDLTFYLSTIAAQMAKDGDDVSFVDQEETEELIDMQRKQNLRETQQGLLERLANAPI